MMSMLWRSPNLRSLKRIIRWESLPFKDSVELWLPPLTLFAIVFNSNTTEKATGIFPKTTLNSAFVLMANLKLFGLYLHYIWLANEKAHLLSHD